MDDLTLAAWLDVTVLISAPGHRARRRGARIIHQRSVRSDGPFVTIRCGPFQDTAPDHDLTCQLGSASSGTVFLDDIDRMSCGWQEELSGFLEFQSRTRRERGLDRPLVRIIAGTASPVGALASSSSFKERLFYRLNVLLIEFEGVSRRRTARADDEPLKAMAGARRM